MNKFICIRSFTKSVRVGQVINGIMINDMHFVVAEDTLDCLFNGRPKFKTGLILPLNGDLWVWKSNQHEDL